MSLAHSQATPKSSWMELLAFHERLVQLFSHNNCVCVPPEIFPFPLHFHKIFIASAVKFAVARISTVEAYPSSPAA